MKTLSMSMEKKFEVDKEKSQVNRNQKEGEQR